MKYLTKQNKIAIVLPYLKSRGTERQGLGIAKSLKNRGWDVTVIALENKGNYHSAFGEQDIDVHIASSKILKKPGKLPLFDLLRMVSYLKREKFDVIVSRAKWSNTTTIMAGLLANISSVVFISGAVKEETFSIPFIIRYYRRLREYLGYIFVSRIVCVSRVGSERLTKRLPLYKDKIKYVQNGLNIEQALLLSNEEIDMKQKKEFEFLFVGSFDINRKGIDILLEAFAKLTKTVSDCQLTLVGSGKDENKLKDMVDSLNIHNKVVFAGEQLNPYPFYRRASVFVLPSRAEGFPNVLIEAMGMGLPAIASDCQTGPSEIIDPNNSGFLFQVGDSDGLEKLMQLLYSDENIRKTVGEKARITIENHFRYEDRMTDLESIIKETL